jgi:hypothetical protein
LREARCRRHHHDERKRKNHGDRSRDPADAVQPDHLPCAGELRGAAHDDESQSKVAARKNATRSATRAAIWAELPRRVNGWRTMAEAIALDCGSDATGHK